MSLRNLTFFDNNPLSAMPKQFSRDIPVKVIRAYTQITLRSFYFLLISTILGCSAPQEPIFKNFANIKTSNISTKKITITADALFHNPNTMGGEVTSTDIEVIVNDIPAGKINQDLAIPVPAGAAFSIPLTVNVSPKDIYENDRGGALGGIVNAVLKKKVDVHYKGTVKMKIAGFPYTLEVDYEEEVRL